MFLGSKKTESLPTQIWNPSRNLRLNKVTVSQRNFDSKKPSIDTTLDLSPSDLIQALKDGNKRFMSQQFQNQNLQNLLDDSCKGQDPLITILGCVDSRVPHEIIFDLNKGDLFSIRIAGNIVNEDIAGSLEFASGVMNTKLVVVLGHTDCGAVKAAIDKQSVPSKFQKLRKLIQKILIKPSNTLDQNIIDNVLHSVKTIESHFQNENSLDSKVIGAIYNVCTGKVDFL